MRNQLDISAIIAAADKQAAETGLTDDERRDGAIMALVDMAKSQHAMIMNLAREIAEMKAKTTK